MYIGSVRFFKHLILLTIITIITVLSLLLWKSCRKISRLEYQLTLTEQLTAVATGGKTPCKELDSGRTKEKQKRGSVDLRGIFHAAAPEYQKLYPSLYAPAKAAPEKTEAKTVYLTFDDGPSACTKQILDTLDFENVKATFFVKGTTNEDDLKTMKEAARKGHTIGMHSYSHSYKYIYASVENFLNDMHNISALIRQTTGREPAIFRFPGGSISAVNERLHEQLMAEMLRRGFVPYDWTVSSGDAETRNATAEAIAGRVITEVSKSSGPAFVLMHDSGKKQATAQALGRIIKELKQKGYSFKAITPDVKPALFSPKYTKGE